MSATHAGGGVPRWEWRAFGDSFPETERRLGALESTRTDDSEELYILSSRVEGSVKVRGGALDVKRLQAVNEDGLEQWNPVAKAEFPLDRADVVSLLAALGTSVPSLERETYDVVQLVEEVVGPHEELRSVPVSKHRVHYLVDGCMAELTSVRSQSRTTRTVAVENEDPAVVRATVGQLGLWSRPNVSFPRGLAHLVGVRTPRRAVVDIGTNSVKFVVGEQAADGTWRPVVDRAEVTRLGQGVASSGRLDPEAMRRTGDAVGEMVGEARAHGVQHVAAVGTAWMRTAENADAFAAELHDRSGVRVEAIDGEEEARLSYLAAVGGLGPLEGPHVLFETGGGSTQVTVGHGARIDQRFSVHVGAVLLTERFGLADAVDETRLESVFAAVASDLAALDTLPTPDVLVGMGGAVTNLAAVKHELAAYDPVRIQGTVLDVAELDRQVELYRTRSAEERRSILGLQPNRAEIILAGACIVRTVLATLRSPSFVVTDRGLRHRLLIERFGAGVDRPAHLGSPT